MPASQRLAVAATVREGEPAVPPAWYVGSAAGAHAFLLAVRARRPSGFALLAWPAAG